VRENQPGPAPIGQHQLPATPRALRRQLDAVFRHAERLAQGRRNRPRSPRPSRPSTPQNQSPVTPHTPQATPRTRRRAEVRRNNPPETPTRRRVPAAQNNSAQLPRQRQQQGRPQRKVKPRPMIAREPLDPPVDVSHSLGPFDVRYNYRSCIH